MTDSNGNMVMPVAPYYGGNGGGFGGFGGDNAWWIIILLIFMGGWGNNGWNGAGNCGGTTFVANDVQRGFDHASVSNGISGLQNTVTTGFGNVQNALCSGFAGVNQGMANGFAQAEIANNARQMADMNQMFGFQTALNGQLNSMAMTQQNCCCENRAAVADLKYTMANEASLTRANCDGNKQEIMDKLCQMELDGIKQNYENRIAGMQNTIDAIRAENQDLKATAGRVADRAAIIANNEAQTAALEGYLAPVPRPAYVVQNPNCCGNFGYGGCGGCAG